MITSIRNNSRRRLRLRVGLAVFAAWILCSQATALAYQTSWTRSQGSQACGALGYATWLNFCRQSGAEQLNRAMTRDSDLRSKTGTISDDKYLDGYIVGTTIGLQPNTNWVSNGFSSLSVSFYGAVNCRQPIITLAAGDAFYPSSSGLMSFAAAGASC